MSSEIEPTTLNTSNIHNRINTQDLHNYGNMSFQNSEVHIGNKIYLNGVIYLAANNEATFTKSDATSSNDDTKSSSRRTESTSDGFIKNIVPKISNAILRVCPRQVWLAQPPMNELEVLQKPVKLVIICELELF